MLPHTPTAVTGIHVEDRRMVDDLALEVATAIQPSRLAPASLPLYFTPYCKYVHGAQPRTCAPYAVAARSCLTGSTTWNALPG